MTKAAKRTMQFTSHTLWTAQCGKLQGEKVEVKITKQLQEDFKKTLAASESALQQKLETFEPIEVSDAAARCLIR